MNTNEMDHMFLLTGTKPFSLENPQSPPEKWRKIDEISVKLKHGSFYPAGKKYGKIRVTANGNF